MCCSGPPRTVSQRPPKTERTRCGLPDGSRGHFSDKKRIRFVDFHMAIQETADVAKLVFPETRRPLRPQQAPANHDTD